MITLPFFKTETENQIIFNFRTVFTSIVDWEMAFSGPTDSKHFPGEPPYDSRFRRSPLPYLHRFHHRLLQMAPTATNGTDCYKWHRLLQMAPTVTNGIDCYKWHRLLQIAPTVTNGIDCYKWHRLLQMAPTVTNGIDCYKWHRLLQMAPTVTNGINCYKWHRLLQMASAVTNGIECLQREISVGGLWIKL